MLDTAKILKNVCNVNDFDITKPLELHQGSGPTDIYLQLYQSDEGMRYIPASGATLQVEFLRMETVAQVPAPQAVIIMASLAFPLDDRSIWKVTVSATQANLIVSGGIRLTLVEGASTKVLFVSNAIRKVPSSGGPF